MARAYLKKANLKPASDTREVRAIVQGILEDIEARGETAALEYASKFDNYDGDIRLSREEIDAAIAQVPERLQADIRFAHDNVRRFAEAQKATLRDIELEVVPGLVAGQKSIPVRNAGCYIPGGRYSHIASAIMTVTTAKVAGCGNIVACSPPRPGVGIAPAIIYAADLCGADTILALGGVQGLAAMAFGLFGLPRADILVGPGNQFVAEAKRILFGRVGIDMFAGPTDSLVLADGAADAEIVAADLVGQAEHGYNSPVWLVSDNEVLARKVLDIVPRMIADLPDLNRTNAEAAWRDYAEVIVCANREEMAATADDYAPEHLTVQAADLDWWLARLQCYGSLFLGEETTVAFGDKAAGPNHVLPTSMAANYTGGLSVHKYMKIVTWQRATREGAKPVAEATARISRLEGMEGHVRAIGDLFSVEGRTACVTGATSGLGRRAADVLVACGCRVVGVARRHATLEAWAGRSGANAGYVAADVGDIDTLGSVAQRVAGIFGTPDILINAAGLNTRQPAGEVSVQGWQSTIDLNLSAPFFLAQAFAGAMRKKGWGRIVNFASLQSYRAFPGGIAYGASKGGVAQLTRAMAEAWSADGINANAIGPGFFRTELTAPVFADPDRAARNAAQTCIGRNGEPEDIDGLILFLSSDASAYVTGQVLMIDGGFTAK